MLSRGISLVKTGCMFRHNISFYILLAVPKWEGDQKSQGEEVGNIGLLGTNQPQQKYHLLG